MVVVDDPGTVTFSRRVPGLLEVEDTLDEEELVAAGCQLHVSDPKDWGRLTHPFHPRWPRIRSDSPDHSRR